jgi:hypothetical protein
MHKYLTKLSERHKTMAHSTVKTLPRTPGVPANAPFVVPSYEPPTVKDLGSEWYFQLPPLTLIDHVVLPGIRELTLNLGMGVPKHLMDEAKAKATKECPSSQNEEPSSSTPTVRIRPPTPGAPKPARKNKASRKKGNTSPNQRSPDSSCVRKIVLQPVDNPQPGQPKEKLLVYLKGEETLV